mmetsp:Transcript_42411/g.31057  ORF Transcript_42411/g.31057 Transcript_42411/m.31057 type:complete len:181 (-) Transcript_42411:743-1285(-)
MVGSSASYLASTFDKESMMPIFQLGLIVFSSFTRFLNAKFFIKIAHYKRIFVNSLIMMSAFLVISFATTYDENVISFYLSLVASVMFGVVSSFGESTTIGFCKEFPSKVVGYFGSGTGFAGVFGAGIILVLQALGLTYGQMFFILTPTFIPYFLCFFWLHRVNVRFKKQDIQGDDYTKVL